MTKRTPISAPKNIWFDAQQVDDIALSLEQNFNDAVQSSTINNHVGTGVLPEVLVQNILFDSNLVSGYLDGIAINTQKQPSDNNFGNQLEIILTKSKVASRRTVKIGIIGLDFQGNLQYETFTFQRNENQVGRKHFTKILTLMFNDFLGAPNLSFNLGGQLLIKEASPLTLSRQPLMVAQDIQPNLFFRDFFLNGSLTLSALLASALPLYNIDQLNIYTDQVDTKLILSGDVTTQIGEKFVATTNNIQKVSLLLSVRNVVVGQETDLSWNGDLIVSIYPLQSDISCATDIAPNLPIDFSPSNIPIAQISINYNSLLNDGILLDSVPQPVDFVFSNSPISGGNILIPGQFYALAVKRAGSANKCDIILSVGNNLIPDSRITTFTGSLWVDIPEQQLWFRIWSDSAKISDGQAYESGHGIFIPKTSLSESALATIDYSKENIQFVGNEVYQAVISASTLETFPVPDERTGNPVLSRQQFVPSVNLLNTLDVISLKKASEPLIIGAITDKNKKFFNSVASVINSNLHSSTLVGDELFIKMIVDTTDVGRYDLSVTELQTNLLLGDFEGAKITTNANNTTTFYRIASASLCPMILGDVDGDGLVTTHDLELLSSYMGYNLSNSLSLNTFVTTDGYTTTYGNGYTSSILGFVSQFNIQFQLVNPITNLVIASASDGVIVADPNNPAQAKFTSSAILFTGITAITQYKLVLLTPLIIPDYGAFDIIGIDTNTDILTIRKILLNGETVTQLLRADIDGDFHITVNDGYLLNQYIDRFPLSTSPVSTYPSPSTNAYTNIGKAFNVIKLKLERYVDRTDDYNSNPILRSTTVHPKPDIFVSDGYFYSHNFYTSPVPIVIEKKLTWNESLILVNSRARCVPSVFSSTTGFEPSMCGIDGNPCNVYGSKPNFDPGLVNYFVPNNLILGEAGELKRSDGEFYKVDFEVGTIVLEIPDGLFGSEKTIDILNDFIASTISLGKPTGVTSFGFPAMKFADCSFVLSNALINDQLRFSVSVQSFSPNTSGLSPDGYSGAIVDGKIGVAIDYSTGLLTLNFTNLFQDAVLETLSTKIQVNVFLKKGGFNNKPIFIDSTKIKNMLSLISVFSGANEGGPSALVDMGFDVTGVLPIIHGGTGLNSAGPFGYVLTSNGSGVSYQYAPSLVGVVPFSLGIPNANNIPKTDGYGLLDPSFMYKNPVYIPAVCGIFSHDGYSPAVIGAFTFRFDKFILEGLQDIKLEVILETTNASNTARIQLFNVNTNSYVNLSTGNLYLSTANTSATFLSSSDIKTLMSIGATNFIYEIHLRCDPATTLETAICKMARLVMTYNNPVLPIPPVAHSSNFVPYLPSPTPF